MRKKRVAPIAAVLCAVYAFSSCSVHIPKPRPTVSQYEKSFAADADWYSDSGRLRLLSDGSGTLNERSLGWKECEEIIQCSLLPESTIGRSFELTEVFSKGLPVLTCGDERYSLIKKKNEPEEEAAVEEEVREPSPEELIAQEGQEAANLCFGFIGWNYKYGGKSPETGFDCSGLVYYVYEQLGYRLERVANAQSKQGVLIGKESMQPGDLLFFGAPDYCSHVGVYVGQGYYIHAMGSAYGVVASSLDDPYLKRPKYEVRRIAGCEWLKIENIEAALAAGLPTPAPPAETDD